MTTKTTRLLVVSFNTLFGAADPAEIAARVHQIENRLERYIDVLCLQENVVDNGIYFADQVADTLGTNRRYRAYFDRGRQIFSGNGAHQSEPPRYPDPAIIWNSEKFIPVQFGLTKLPILTSIPRRYRPFMNELRGMPLLERIIASDKTLKQYMAERGFTREQSAPWMRLGYRGIGDLFTVTSMHLETWGGNSLRQLQLVEAGKAHSVRHVICGDTNIYRIGHPHIQLNALHNTLSESGFYDPGNEATFFPKRSDYCLIRLLNRLRLMQPVRLDVIATTPDLRTVRHGTLNAEGLSDHDFVYALIS